MVSTKSIGTGLKLLICGVKKILPQAEQPVRRVAQTGAIKSEQPLLSMAKTVAVDTFQSSTKVSGLGLSIEDKIRILIDRYGIPAEKYGFSQENLFKKMIKMNYPFELAELSYKAEQSMPKCGKIIPEIHPSDKARGKELIEWYQHSFKNCGSVNNSLREGKALDGRAREFQEFFDANPNILTENMGLIRGSSYLPQVKPGDIITDKGFTSTMRRQGIPDVLIDGSAGHTGYYKDFLVIRAKAGQKCIIPEKWGASAAQSEIILPKGTSLKVLEVKPLADNGLISRSGNIIQEPVNDRRVIICDII